MRKLDMLTAKPQSQITLPFSYVQKSNTTFIPAHLVRGMIAGKVRLFSC